MARADLGYVVEHRYGTCYFLEVVNKHAPLKQHRVKKGHQPEWLSPETIDNIKERNKRKLNGDQDGYVFFRNEVSSMIKTAKNNMYKLKKVKTIPALFGKFSNLEHHIKRRQVK